MFSSPSVLSRTPKPSKLPILLNATPVPAGFPSPVDNQPEGTLDLNRHLIDCPAATFFVRARGLAMPDAGIYSGDLLIVDRSLESRSGDIVIVAEPDGFSAKRLIGEPVPGTVGSGNSRFTDYPTDPESSGEIWGVVPYSVRSHRKG